MKINTERPRYYVSPEAQASVHSKQRQYTAAGHEVQVPWGGKQDWRKTELEDW